MNLLFKKSYLLCLLLIFFLQSCLIQNPKPEECAVVQSKIVKITEGSSYDIVLHSENDDFFYINRGIEAGLNIDSLRQKILNKTVTLHLARLFAGTVTSEHIAQLAVNDKILYTEFK